jgi:hypothetical protein
LLQARERTAVAKKTAYDKIWNGIQTANKNRGNDEGIMFPKALSAEMDAWQK